MNQTADGLSIIKLLPPEISNKIAAGEVIDLPASVVKELLDNAIDAGASSIQVIIQNAGRTLLQVIDDGCGMSEQDMKMCFVRHATSKISSVDDLFKVRTLGFRGEAMASIAAVSQVLVQSKRAEDDAGNEMEIWGGEERFLQPAALKNGTSVSIRNLFFNVPARRQFLKTDITELRHILRVVQFAALSHPDVAFEVFADGDKVYSLPVTVLDERISLIFGRSYKASLIPFSEETSMMRIHGFASDPKLAKKSRGEQFLFVNGRPFQHRYLTHVLLSLYDSWTRNGEYPFFAVFFELDAAMVDVNVHPSKMEVKFEDERSVIQLARSVVKRALNEHFSVPDLGDQNSMFYLPQSKDEHSGNFNHFYPEPTRESSFQVPSRINFDKPSFGNVGKLSELLYSNNKDSVESASNLTPEKPAPGDRVFWQLHQTYIFSQTRSGCCIIDQHSAHKRIIFERTLNATAEFIPSTQQLLFAQTEELSASDYLLLKEHEDTVRQMGFSLQLLSGNTVVINGVPADLGIGSEHSILKDMLSQFNEYGKTVRLNAREKLALAFASKAAVSRGKRLTQNEMESLFDQLFETAEPYKDPLGKSTVIFIPITDIQSRF